MKKLITNIILMISAGIILSSCSNGISLTKRHYRNGYHFAHSAKPVTPKTNVGQANYEPRQSGNIDQIVVPAEEVVFANTEKGIEISKNENKPAHLITLEEIKYHPAGLSGASQTSEESLNTNSLDNFTNSSFQFKKESKSKDDALSLFWTVILVIIIIWIVAFFFGGGWGLGGLINLLLLIALILLILWLLRII